jgi:hypothetical protein
VPSFLFFKEESAALFWGRYTITGVLLLLPLLSLQLKKSGKRKRKKFKIIFIISDRLKDVIEVIYQIPGSFIF